MESFPLKGSKTSATLINDRCRVDDLTRSAAADRSTLPPLANHQAAATLILPLDVTASRIILAKSVRSQQAAGGRQPIHPPPLSKPSGGRHLHPEPGATHRALFVEVPCAVIGAPS